MKTATIVHGWDGSPSEPMLRWIKGELEKRGYDVVVPAMPNPGEPTIEAWVDALKEAVRPGAHMALIGHSIGAQAVLRYIETLDPGTIIEKVILVAPWIRLDMRTIEEEGVEAVRIAKPWMETPIGFAKIRSRVGKTIAIFSDNDPYVPLDQRELFERELGAETLIEHNKGHFTASDNVTALPSIQAFL